MAKKPMKVPTDTLTAIAAVGVELAVLSDKIDKLASRLGQAERKLADTSSINLHLIEVKEAVASLRTRRWWEVWK